MRLILVRHAEAVGYHMEDEEEDFSRQLTEQGLKQAADLASALRRLNVRADAVATSPLVRTQQTADALASLLPAGREIVVNDRLRPDELRPRKLSKAIAEFDAETVILVGHMPGLGEYAAWLLGGGRDCVPFEKGGAACFEVDADAIDEGKATLQWFVTPEWCRVAEDLTSR